MNLKRTHKMLKKTYCADIQVIYCETLHSQLDSDGCTVHMT